MYQWEKQIQQMVDEIDTSIRAHNDDALTLSALSRRLGLPPHRVLGRPPAGGLQRPGS